MPKKPLSQEISASVESEAPQEPLPSLTPIERRAFDYMALDDAIARLDLVVRNLRFSFSPSCIFEKAAPLPPWSPSANRRIASRIVAPVRKD